METNKISRNATRPCYDLSLNFKSRPSLTDSKLGGLPYWDSSIEYPTDEMGLPMKLLCQINFSKHRMAKPLPSQGLLQFFIADSQGLYGYDPENPNIQRNFRIVYHPTMDHTINKRTISKFGYPCFGQLEEDPIHEEYALRIKKGESAIETYCDDKDFHLLGYPSFAQSEPQGLYDTLLLQVPSLRSQNGYAALWGDCGILNFFIKENDLRNNDFSDVIYHFDCC